MPALVRSLDALEFCGRLEVVGDHIYVAGHRHGLGVLRLTAGDDPPSSTATSTAGATAGATSQATPAPSQRATDEPGSVTSTPASPHRLHLPVALADRPLAAADRIGPDDPLPSGTFYPGANGMSAPPSNTLGIRVVE